MTPETAAKAVARCAYRHRGPHADLHAADGTHPRPWIEMKRWDSVANRAPSSNNGSGYSFENS